MIKQTIRHLLVAAALGLAALSPQAASAAASVCGTGAPYLLNYSFDMQHEVTAIAKYNSYLPECGTGIANSDTAPVGTSLLTDIFAKRDPVGRTLLFGVASDLPGDPEGQQHLVLFTNNAWANSAQSIAFGTLFPTINEASLIDALLNLANGTGSENDYGQLFSFADAGGDPLFSPNGDAAFMFGDDFTAIAFSDGQIIGSGRSFLTPEIAAVPEPAVWAMMIVGFGAIGSSLRSRRRSALSFQ